MFNQRHIKYNILGAFGVFTTAGRALIVCKNIAKKLITRVLNSNHLRSRKNKYFNFILTLFLLSISSCQYQLKNNDFLNKTYNSNIINQQGKVIGKAKITQGNDGILINIDAKNLPAGAHGMHFHQVADCNHKKGFKSAKGHIMPKNKPHGFLHPKGPHAGNLPNLIVAKNGQVQVELYSNLLNLHKIDSRAALLDENGSTLIIHKYKDDHFSQPIGGAGPRIGCAKITK